MDDRMPSQPDRPRSGGPTISPNARPRLPTTDPSNNQPGTVYEGHTREEALMIAREVHSTWGKWRRTSFSERAALMRGAAQAFRRRTDEFAELMTKEMGKTLMEGRSEIDKCAFNCDYFAENGERFLARRAIDIGVRRRS